MQWRPTTSDRGVQQCVGWVIDCEHPETPRRSLINHLKEFEVDGHEFAITQSII